MSHNHHHPPAGSISRRRMAMAIALTLTFVIGEALAGFLSHSIALWLRSGAKNDLNLRSAYLHMLGDAVSAFGVVIAGVVILLTGLTAADVIVSLLIAGLILWSSWGVLAESVNILMDGTPAGLDMAGLTKSITGVTGVLGVHDLHVWT